VVFTNEPLLIVQTPYQAVSTVILTHNTWEQKILLAHPEMEGKLEDIEATLASPSVVCGGSTNPKNVIFISNDVVSPHGSPLVVIVRSEKGEVRTASYRREYRYETPGGVLWLPPA